MTSDEKIWDVMSMRHRIGSLGVLRLGDQSCGGWAVVDLDINEGKTDQSRHVFVCTQLVINELYDMCEGSHGISNFFFCK